MVALRIQTFAFEPGMETQGFPLPIDPDLAGMQQPAPGLAQEDELVDEGAQEQLGVALLELDRGLHPPLDVLRVLERASEQGLGRSRQSLLETPRGEPSPDRRGRDGERIDGIDQISLGRHDDSSSGLGSPASDDLAARRP